MLTTEEAYQYRKAVELEVLANDAAKLLNRLQAYLPYSLENIERLKVLSEAEQQCSNLSAEARRKTKEFIGL